MLCPKCNPEIVQSRKLEEKAQDVYKCPKGHWFKHKQRRDGPVLVNFDPVKGEDIQEYPI